MTKSKWIEVIEWCVLAGIVVFMLGVFLTSADQEPGSSKVPLSQLDE